MNNLFDLNGRTALVTGSSRGIGAAIALSLAGAGADIAVHFGENVDRAQEVAKQAARFGVKAAIVGGDLSTKGGAQKVFAAAVATLGRLDILVLNASIQIPKKWTAITREDFDKQVAVNYRSSLELLQLTIPPMAERRWGRVLTIGSVQELVPNAEMLVYSSLKNAQTALGHSLAKQYASHGVTVNNIAPGVIATDRYHDRVTTPERTAQVLAWIPAGFVGEARDFGSIALLLCSDAGRYITGQNLFVDGGMSL